MDKLDWCMVALCSFLLVFIVFLIGENTQLSAEVRVLSESIDGRPLPPKTDLITFDNGRIRMQCYAPSLDPNK